MLGSAGVYSDGSILSEKALKIAERLGCNAFKKSNGWLNLWKKSYNARQIKTVVSQVMCLVLQLIHGSKGF